MCTILVSTRFGILKLPNLQYHHFAPAATLLIFVLLVFVLAEVSVAFCVPKFLK
jgi:hypothetical protein